MILDVVFYYHADAVPTRARKPRTVYMRDEVSVKIEEIADDAYFPAVASVTPMYPETRKEPPFEIRTNGEDFFIPASQYGPMSAEELVEAVKEGREHRNPFYHVQSFSIPKYNNWPHDDHRTFAGRIESSKRAEDIAKIQDIAASYVIFDGQLMQRVGEPVWRMKGNWSYELAYLDEEMLKNEAARLIRFDKMDEFVENLRAGAEGPSLFVDNYEILDDKYFRLSTTAPALIGMARRAVESMRADISRSVDNTTVDQFAFYVDFRDAVAANGDFLVSKNLERVVEEYVERGGKSDYFTGELSRKLADWKEEVYGGDGLPELDDAAASLKSIG